MTSEIDDERAIARLLAEYGNRLDRGDHDGWLDLFVADGEFLVYGRSFAGREGLAKMASTAPPGVHLASAPVITVSGDEAHAQQSFLFVDQATREQRIGYYDDVVVRDGGRWRFRSRRTTFLTPDGPSDRP